MKAVFSCCFGDGTNYSAKLKAIMEGIQLCNQLQFCNVVIESNSRIVVDWTRKGQCTAWYLWDFFEELETELKGVNFMVLH